MTNLMIFGGGIVIITLLIWAYGAAKKKQGKTQERAKRLKGEMNAVERANKIENDHKHDSRNDIIDGL